MRVRVSGELDLSTSPELGRTLEREFANGSSVVLDLSAVTFIDSTGLNTLISGLRACDSNGCSLAVSADLPAQVSRVFAITGLEGVLPVVVG